MKIPDTMPHRMVDSIAEGLVGAVEGLGNSAVGAIKGVGKAVMGGLDKPFDAVAPGREGPHRIADRLADGAVDGITNFGRNGVIGSIKMAGKGVMSALDQPLEQLKK